MTGLVSHFCSAGPVSEQQVLAAIDRGVEAGAGERGGVHWVLDPIDGTKAGCGHPILVCYPETTKRRCTVACS